MESIEERRILAILERSEAANQHIKHLVESGVMRTSDGELLLSKIALGCIEIGHLIHDLDVEPDVDIALQNKSSQLDKVLRICENY